MYARTVLWAPRWSNPPGPPSLDILGVIMEFSNVIIGLFWGRYGHNQLKTIDVLAEVFIVNLQGYRRCRTLRFRGIE